MGLLDDITKLTGSSGDAASGSPSLAQSLLQMLAANQQGGGLASVLQGFQQAGLGGAVSSWIGTAANAPISPDQLRQGLGAENMQKLAQSVGLSDGAAASELAGLLPSIIDRLTPDGTVPDSGSLQQRVATLTKLLGF